MRPRVLDDALLDELGGRWRDLGAPISDALRPGLTDAEIGALTAPLGLVLPEEARRWWRWHDGASAQPESLNWVDHRTLPSDRSGRGASAARSHMSKAERTPGSSLGRVGSAVRMPMPWSAHSAVPWLDQRTSRTSSPRNDRFDRVPRAGRTAIVTRPARRHSSAHGATHGSGSSATTTLPITTATR
jgi:hypothetical protein